MLRVTFLGTAAARPTVARGVSAVAVQRESRLFLFDCGEGTQRQMMRYGTGFGVEAIFVSHLHGDHFLGITGLLRTLALQDRREAILIYGPPGSGGTLEEAAMLGVDRIRFPVVVRELEGGQALHMDDFSIQAFGVHHGTPALGYALVEKERPGRFDVELARKMGVPEGPLYGRLHRGESVEVDGKVIHPRDLVGPPRPGRKVVYTGDTRPFEGVRRMAEGADLLIHEGTFGDGEEERALETYHSTAREAGRLACQAGVRRLILTHISARHSDAAEVLEAQAREELPQTRFARDGLTLEIPFPDEGEAEV